MSSTQLISAIFKHVSPYWRVYITGLLGHVQIFHTLASVVVNKGRVAYLGVHSVSNRLQWFSRSRLRSWEEYSLLISMSELIASSLQHVNLYNFVVGLHKGEFRQHMACASVRYDCNSLTLSASNGACMTACVHVRVHVRDQEFWQRLWPFCKRADENWHLRYPLFKYYHYCKPAITDECICNIKFVKQIGSYHTPHTYLFTWLQFVNPWYNKANQRESQQGKKTW